MTFSFSLFQVSLVLIVIVAGAAALMLGGKGNRFFRWPRFDDLAWKDDAAHRHGLIVIDPTGKIIANQGARLLLGGFSGRPPTRRAISARIGAPASGAADVTEFEKALSALTTRGVSFTLSVDTKAGKRLTVLGEPRGASVALTLHNITEISSDVVTAKAQADLAAKKVDALTCILTTANVIAGRLDADGLLVWRSEALANLPGGTRETLKRSARMLNSSTDLTNASSDVVIGDVSYTLDILQGPESGVLFHASPAQEVTGGEEAFRRFVNTMAETFAHLKVGLMIFDNDRRLTLFNPATMELFGGDAAWFARRPTIGEILDGMREMRAIPDQANFITWRDDLLAQFEGEGASEYIADWQLSDGRTIHIMARPHPSGGLAVTAEDITESIDLLRSSAEEKAVMLATTDFLEEALIVFGPDGLSRLANAAFIKMWNFRSDAFKDPVHISEVTRHCIAQGGGEAYWSMALDRVTTGGGRRKALEKFRLPNDIIVQGRYSPMPDGSALLATSDITGAENAAIALRQRNEALEHADEMRGALVDQISHQMRTPLNAVSGFGQLLVDERIGPLTARQRVYVEGIVQSSGELLDAINGMTDLITPGPDSMSLRGELLDPSEMMRDVVDLASHRLGAESTKINLVCEDVTASFQAHRIRLRQIIFNILVDVMSKNKADGEIDAALDMEGRKLVISVSHEPMADATSHGLALSLVRRFASLHDGTVNVVITDERRRCVTCILPESEAVPQETPGEDLSAELPLAVEV